MPKAKKLPSGSWRCQVYLGKDGNGKNIYKSVTAGTKKRKISINANNIAFMLIFFDFSKFV